MSKKIKKKSNIWKNNKKEIIILALFLILALIAVLFERSYALPDEEPESVVADKDYASDSAIQDGDKVKTGDTIKYVINYADYTSTIERDVIIEDTLSKGLEYDEGSSSLGEPIEKNVNEDGTTTLTWETSLNAGEPDSMTYSANVTDNAEGSVDNSVIVTIGEKQIGIVGIANDIKGFTVTYESDENGIVEGEPSEEKMKNETPTGRSTNTDEGYVLKEWICNKTVTLINGTTIEAGSPITNEQITLIKVTEDITLTAIHEASSESTLKYTVTYKDGDETIDEIQVDPGEEIVLAELPDKDEYRKIGWTIDNESKNPGEIIPINKNTIIKAVYEKINNQGSYTVIYKFDDEEIETKTVSGGEKIIIRNLPTKDGCEIKKWQVNNEEIEVGEELEISANTIIISKSICTTEETKKETNTELVPKDIDKSNVNPSSTETTKVNSSRFSNSKIYNPKTGDRIMTYVLIAISSLVVVVALLIAMNAKNKKDNTKKNK